MPENVTFGRAFYITCIIVKLIITRKEPIEGIKVWILLGYPSKYCNYTSNEKLGGFLHSPRPRPPPVDNFFNIHLSQNIIEIKDVEFDFRMCCTLVLVQFLWIIIVQFTSSWFFNFLFFYLQNLGYWLTLIQNSHFYHWNFFKTKFT